MKTLRYTTIEGTSPAFLAFAAGLGVLILLGFISFVTMEHEGHYITGMTNVRDVIPFPRVPGYADF